MPPKPQIFKTPDGKEFTSRAEWRDYMMATFYSFKNKVGETLTKAPGDIGGQMFDIGDCDNSTLVLLDNTEQVQIDVVTNSRIFIGACASSIFIRNCSNCVFYTCCRQLRLREVVNCTFYIYSMSEVHIEYSNNLKFAPFNGGYPEHAEHLRIANLDQNHNLWYDIFDHNDPGRTRVNWSLLPEAEYEAPWFPMGECARAVAVTKAGSVSRPEADGSDMQSFSMEQLIADAQAIAQKPPSPQKSAVPTSSAAAAAATVTAPAPPSETVAAAPAVQPAAPMSIPALVAALAASESPASLLKLAAEGSTVVLANGEVRSFADYAASATARVFLGIEQAESSVDGTFAWASFLVASATTSGAAQRVTAVFGRDSPSASWTVARLHFAAEI